LARVERPLLPGRLRFLQRATLLRNRHVAGGDKGAGTLAWKAPDSVLTNGTGIDHFDDTVLPIFLSALPACIGT
jgi:hypothetical protein